jgi:hypothetical protein
MTLFPLFFFAQPSSSLPSLHVAIWTDFSSIELNGRTGVFLPSRLSLFYFFFFSYFYLFASVLHTSGWLRSQKGQKGLLYVACLCLTDRLHIRLQKKKNGVRAELSLIFFRSSGEYSQTAPKHHSKKKEKRRSKKKKRCTSSIDNKAQGKQKDTISKNFIFFTFGYLMYDTVYFTMGNEYKGREREQKKRQTKKLLRER